MTQQVRDIDLETAAPQFPERFAAFSRQAAEDQPVDPHGDKVGQKLQIEDDHAAVFNAQQRVLAKNRQRIVQDGLAFRAGQKAVVHPRSVPRQFRRHLLDGESAAAEKAIKERLRLGKISEKRRRLNDHAIHSFSVHRVSVRTSGDCD